MIPQAQLMLRRFGIMRQHWKYVGAYVLLACGIAAELRQRFGLAAVPGRVRHHNLRSARILLSALAVVSTVHAFSVYPHFRLGIELVIARAHVAARARYVTLQRLADDTLEAIRTAFRRSVEVTIAELQSFASTTVRDVQGLVLTSLEARIDTLTETALQRVRETVIDPEMPLALQQVIGDSVTRLGPDLKRALVNQANKYIMTPALQPVEGSLTTAPSTTVTPTMANRAPTTHTSHRGGGNSTSRSEATVEADTPSTPSLLVLGPPALAGAPAPSESSNPPWHQHATARALDYWHRFRAFVLYRYSPCDKSFWMLVRDPVYWLLFAVGLIPIPSLAYAWWLAFFFMKDRSDEYQLVDYIVGFETAKFFANGCWGLVYGSGRYFTCTSFPLLFPCHEVGPAMSSLDCIFFVLQVALVFGAYTRLLALPQAVRASLQPSDAPVPVRALSLLSNPLTRLWQRTVPRSAAAAPSATGTTEQRRGRHGHASAATTSSSQATAGPTGHSKLFQAAAMYDSRGGAIQLLFRYHLTMVCVCASLMLLAAAVVLFAGSTPSDGSEGGARLCVSNSQLPPAVAPGFFFHAMYWIRTLYGLFALPYVPFKIPIIMRLYVTKRFTGYNEAGLIQPNNVIRVAATDVGTSAHKPSASNASSTTASVASTGSNGSAATKRRVSVSTPGFTALNALRHPTSAIEGRGAALRR